MAGPEPRAGGGAESLPSVLAAAGLVFVGLGIMLAIVHVVGGVRSSLFPTGWIFPAVLIVTGCLMTLRRRFDIVATLWGGLTLAVFLLGMLVYVNGLDRGLDDAAAFDSALIVATFALIPLILRPQFRS